MPPALGYAALMFAAGIGIPILAALNGALGARIGAASAAALVLFLVALLVAFAAVAVSGSWRSFASVPEHPPFLMLGGVLVAFYVLSITWVAPKFGVGNAVFFVLLGQLVAAAAIDHYGFFGAKQSSLTPVRAAGIALMAMGVLLARKV
ncbi:MAG: DMT family transporter [Pseudomonadota bacterium]